MTLRYTIFLIIAGVLMQVVGGCSHGPSHSRLLLAEGIMDDNPDSALIIVTAIDTNQLRSQGDRALYALLLTQALDKTYHDIASDSTIKKAVEYYYDHPDDARLMKALYYRGRTQFYAKNYTKVVEYALESIELAEKFQDYYFLGKNYDMLSDTYLNTLIIPLQKKYSALASQNYLKAGKILNHRYSLLDQSLAYLNNREYDEGIRLIDSLMSLTDISPQFLHSCRKGLLVAQLHLEKYAQARVTYDSILCNKELGLSLYDICNNIRLLELENQTNEALAQVDSLLPYYPGYSQLGHLAARLNAHKGDYRKAYQYQTEIYNAIDSTVTAIIKQSTINAESDFHNSRAVYFHRQARISGIIIWCILGGVAVIGLALIVVYREKRKRSRVELELKMHEIRELTETLGAHITAGLEKDERVSALTSRINSAFTERLERMNRLCESYFIDGHSAGSDSRIYREIKSLISDFTTDDIRAELYESVNRRSGDALSRLREQMPRLSESDVLLLAYVFMGFSPKAISILLDMKIGTVYMKRSRLKERIERSEIADKERILSLFP